MAELAVAHGAPLGDQKVELKVERRFAEPKPPAPPVTIAEALVRSIRTPNRLILEAGAVARR
jgi:hypothetical protein